MTESPHPSDPSKPAKYILHPTDFSGQSDIALAHALRMALTNRAQLEMLHVGNNTDEEWDGFPSIRTILQHWGLIEPGATREEVVNLGIGIDKVIASKQSVVDSIVSYCERRPVDLIVMATAGRDGVSAWLRPSKAEKIAEAVSALSIPTLFVPSKCRGCVDPDSGKVSMDHVLVPVDHQPSSESAVERGLRAVSMYGSRRADLTLLHVGPESQFPQVDIPDGNWNIRRTVRSGIPATEIAAAAHECDANLIVMVTEGTHGFLDIFRGTTTEQVLRHSPCPLLAVPAEA